MRKLKIITTVILFIFIYPLFFYGETGGEETRQDQKAIIITPAPTITFTYPVEGDNLEPGSYQTITWNKTGTQDAQVKIILMRSDAEVQTLAATTENDGSFTWQVPINLESASDYMFRIENLYMPVKGDSEPVSIAAKQITYKWDFGDGTRAEGPNPTHIYTTPGTYHWTLDITMNGITCQKKGTVTIQPAPTITFTCPSAGNNLEPGSYQTITWNKTGFQDARVRIKLLRSDTAALNLATSTENDGAFTWQVPINLESASDYMFRIETLYMPLHGDSDPVSITAKKITYKWDFGDGTRSTEANPVHIYEKPGTYHWTLDTAMNGITCQKTGTVTIQPAPTITFTYPSAGHNLEPGTYQTITWNRTGFQDAQVRIKLLRSDALVQTLAANTENDGAFTWQVPINLEPAADYVFRLETLYMPVHEDSAPVSISAEQITYKWDFGDGTQATGPIPKHTYEKPGTYNWTLDTTMNGITCQKKGTIDILGPYITIGKPRQGDNVEPGYGYTVTWSKTGPQAAWVKIDLQKNGTTVQTISERTGNDGTYTWQVPLSQETGTGYTIRIETGDGAVTAGSETFGITVIPVVYQWDFGDGTAGSNEQNPVHQYTKTGDYTWKMTAVKGEETCEKTGVITVRPKPVITITSPKQGDNVEPGYPTTVTWTRTGTQAEWVKIDLQKNGTTVLNLSQRTENDGSFTWQVPQNQETGTGYTIRIETEDSGVTGQGESFSIAIIPVTYEWDFGDGTPHSNETNPEHVYTKTGQFTWKMTAVKGEETCETTGVITVRPKPAITVTGPKQGDNVEPGYPTIITWTRTGTQAEWVKIDLQKNGTTVLNLSPRTENDGSYTWQVPLDQETGTGYTFRIETEDSGVSSRSQSFNITIIPVTYEWDFGDGTPHSNEANPQHVYTKTGQFTWKMTAAKGEETCEKTGVITVRPKPAITVTSPKQGDNVEPGYPTTITWTRTGTQAEWVKIDLQKNGTTVLNLSLRTENDGSFTWQVPQNQETGTGYTLRIITGDNGVSSNSEAFGINNIPVVYQWDFGDGTPHSNEANPEHIYTKTGQFTWKMTAAKGEETCQKTGIIHVLPKNLIAFTYPRQGDNLEPGSYQTITWNETGDQDAQVRLQLLRKDTLVQTLAAGTENDGAFTWQVPVNLEPAADYVFRIEALTTQYLVDSEPVSITAKKITYKWDFGDGNSSTEANPVHIYATPDTYHWTLDTTMDGKTCQKKGSVTIQDAPTITFSYPQKGNNLEPGSYQTITWDKTGFQDAQVRIKLMRNDAVVLNLSSSTENDGSFTWQVPINLESATDYKFRIEALYMPLHGESDPVSITAKEITYKWNFGDGNTSNQANPIHIYATPDTYHWTLDTTMDGKTCRKKGSVTIKDAPTIIFSYPQKGNNLEPGSYQTITWNKTGFQDAQVRIKLMRNDAVVLNLSSSTENDGSFTWQVPINLESATDYKFRIEALYMPLHGESDPVSITAKEITYKWDFGDGTQATGPNPKHIYEKPGTYHWTLDTTMDGKTCRKKGSVTIKDAPTITFTYPSAGNNLEPGSYQTVTWNKTGSQDARVRIKLMRNDAVVLNLSSSTENSGNFTWQVPINLESAADYKFRVETLYMPLHGESDPVSITAKGITYKWDFGDGSRSTEANPVHIYEKPGEYHWTLETTMDGLTCQKKGTVKAGPAPTITFSYPQAGHNLEPGSYQTITWNKTGFQDAQVRIKLMRSDALVQTLSTSTGNDGAFTWQVPINLEPAEDYIFRVETLYMPVHGDSKPVSIVAKPITYKWDFGDNTQATGPNPTHIYKKPGIYHWKMEAEIDGITCTSTGAVVFPGQYIMITNPKQGDNLPIGSLCTVTWIKSEIPDATVKIDLLKNGAKVLAISPQTENDGSFDWTVPASLEPGTDYAIFMETTDTHINRIGFRFSISKPTVPAAERAALIALYNSTNGDNWTDNGGWKTPPLHTDGFALPGTENTWHGVTCNTNNTTVESINLRSNKLAGQIPPQLGNLTNLNDLNLGINQLTGGIPTGLGNLTKLRTLHLGNNPLGGSIPPELGKLTNLENFQAGNCKLTGNIPGELGNLTNLQVLFLRPNQLTGSIPKTIGNLTKLTELNISQNQLSGTIPPELENLVELQYLNLGRNKQLSGDIPTGLGKLVKLQTLFINACQLTGTIPRELGNLANLEQFSLSENMLTGTIPTELCNLKNLSSFYLDGNQLTGNIPPELANLVNLAYLQLAKNRLTGSIPPELGNLKKLRYLILSDNRLTGTIPVEIGSLTALQILGLRHNQLTGSIPPVLGNLTELRQLSLYENQLSGSIPPELGNLKKLDYLYLRNNRLTGIIPPELGNLTNLKGLLLDKNHLSGSIPPELGNLVNVTQLWIDGNQLKGEIPTGLTNLVKMSYISTCTNIGYNALYTDDNTLRLFLNKKDPGWDTAQTIAPSEVSAEVLTDSSIKVAWTPIPYTANEGGYRVFYGKTAGGPYTFYKTTADKTVSSMTIDGLSPGTAYYIVVQTRTEPNENNNNIVDSEYSKEVSAPTTSAVIIPNDPDFNNDGKVDILWRNNATGENMVWFMDGIHKIAGENLETKDNLKWKIVGTGDFNGDGKVDILWRNFTNGKNRVWFMDGITKTGAKGLEMWTNMRWRIVGTGDFNEDGKVDILWRNFTNGKNRVWFMDGITKTGAKGLEMWDNMKWRIVGTGDFNEDGKVDILWRNFTNGKNRVWFMDGITKTGAKGLEKWDNLKWEIVSTGDFNGDNKVDILWRNYTNGKNRVWFMDGVTKTGAKGLDILPDTHWKVFDSGD